MNRENNTCYHKDTFAIEPEIFKNGEEFPVSIHLLNVIYTFLRSCKVTVCKKKLITKYLKTEYLYNSLRFVDKSLFVTSIELNF